MWIFSKIFKKKRDNEEIGEENEQKERKEKKKSNARRAFISTALMLMLLVSIYAEPAHAGIIDWLKENTKPNWEGVGNFFRTLKNNVLGGSGGAYFGAKLGMAIGTAIAPGIGTAIGAGIGAAIGYIAGAHIEQHIKDAISNSPIGKLWDWLNGDDNKDNNGLSLLQPRNITYNEYASKTTLLEVFNTTFVNITDLIQAEYQDFLELKARLAPQPVAYDVEEPEGNVGEFKSIKIIGPGNILGFSAIPIKFQLSPTGNDQVKDPICLQKVSLYVYTSDGRKLWTRTWTFENNEKCGEEDTVWTFETILKGPDPYENEIDKIINGLADEDTVTNIYHSSPANMPYEIVAEVYGVRQIYYNVGGEWKFDHNETLSARWRTTSAYKHLAAGRVAIGGFSEGSLPVDMKDDPKAYMFVPYMMRGSGAASNIIVRAWANPLHIINASATYKFYIGGNTEFFDEIINDFTVKITDESRIVVYRILTNDQWELAAKLPLDRTASLGDITQPTHLEGSVFYHGASNVGSYRIFFAIKANVERDDGVNIPIWMLIEPIVTPQSNLGRVIRLDPTFKQIENLTSDNEWSTYDAEQAKALVDSIIAGLNEKIDSAEYWINRGSQLGNQDVVKYAQKAKECYQEAISFAEKIKGADNVNDVLRYLEVIRDEEMAGDYYLEAARQASYGNLEQAQTLATTAGEVEEVANEYKGGLSAFFGNLPDDWSDLSELLPFLLKIALSILAVWIGKQLFGGVGALVALVLVGLYWFGPVIGVSL